MTAKNSLRVTGPMPWRLVALWLAVAVLVRLAAAWWAGLDLPCSYDGCSYLRLARALGDGQGWLTEKGFLWPPGYPAFLALLVPAAEAVTAPWARLVQALLGGLLVWPVAHLVWRVAAQASQRPLVALHVACGFMALDPTLIAYSHLLWPETVFLLLFTPALAVLGAAGGRSSWQFGAGMLLGAAALVKAIGFWLTLPLALAAAGGRGQRGRAALLTLAGVLLLVLPWTARNALTYHQFVLIDATAGTNLYLGNTSAPPVCWDWGDFQRSRVRDARQRCQEGDFINRDRCEQKAALAWIAANPAAFAGRAITKWADLVNPTSFLVRHVRAGRYRDIPMAQIPQWWAATATAAAALPWLMLALLSAWGLSVAPPGPVRRMTLILVLALLALHALTFGMSRFRLPAMPLLAVFAGVAVARFMAGQKALPSTLGSRLLLGAALAGLLVLWGLRLPGLLNFAPFTGI